MSTGKKIGSMKLNSNPKLADSLLQTFLVILTNLFLIRGFTVLCWFLPYSDVNLP